ncbi:MAG: transposase [Bacteroidetes bacterium]|nr:transposase [Bacteroidota bacterium]
MAFNTLNNYCFFKCISGAIIKRQIINQHHSVSAKHLPKYVAECVFKYNNRNEDDMFETLVKNSMLSPLK